MIVVTGFLSILNQIEFHLVQNRKENCFHDHIPFSVKLNGNIVFSLQCDGKTTTTRRTAVREIAFRPINSSDVIFCNVAAGNSGR